MIINRNKSEEKKGKNIVGDSKTNKKKLTPQRKKELQKEIDDIIKRLTDNDILTLEEMGDLTPEEIEYIKKRKKRRKSKKQIFEESIRCDEETINRIIQIGKKYSAQRKAELINEKSREERIKDKNEIQKSGGGRTRQRDDR